MNEIADFDLVIKQGVVATTIKRYDDIRAGWRELQQLDVVYAEPGRFWVALDHTARLIGCVGLRSLGDSKGSVGRLGVELTQRERGIGSKLMTELVSYADESGFSELTLGTHTSQGVVGLYEKFGFVRTDELEGDGDIVMCRYAPTTHHCS